MSSSEAETVEGTTLESLAIPSAYDDAVYESAVTVDRRLEGAGLDANQVGVAVRDHPDVLWKSLAMLPFRWRAWDLAWPSTWYIPGEADYRSYWILPPSAANRYSYQWKTQTYDAASSATGELYAFRQLAPNQRFVSSEAGLGFLYTPTVGLGTVSLRPDVDCRGNFRWWQMLDQPIAGFTHSTTDLVLAMWHQIPGGWDLINFRSVAVGDGYPQTGSGFSAVAPYQRTFAGDDLATNFVVQRGHTYLFGVVARVNISSTLTDSQGGPIAMPPDLSDFRIWGDIACRVPLIELRQGVVYIP